MGPKKAGGKKPGAKAAAAPAPAPAAGGDDAKAGPAGGKSGAARKAGKGKKGAEEGAAAAARPPPTPEEACKLLWRCHFGMRGRMEVAGLRHAKKKADMEEMKRKMWMEQIKAEQRKRQAEDKIKKDKKDKEALKKRQQEEMFEAAFDGEVEKMAELVEKGVSIHITDPHDNTPVGEAAVAGQTEAVKWLLDKGADPNVRGAYERTPLFRAAFNSHTETVKLLLERGGDPRLEARSETPADVASGECKKVLQEWDVSKSEAIIKRLNQDREAREKARKEEAERLAKDLEGNVDDLESKYKNFSRLYCKAKCSLEERILEYDKLTRMVAGERQEVIDAALSALHDAEKHKEEVKEQLDEAQDKLYQARLKLRVHQKKELNADDPGVEIKVKALPEVAIVDVGGKIAAEGKWPFVIDYSGQARIFLQYRDTNYVNAINGHHMEPEMLRKALLGAIRYGKPMVVDLMDVDILDRVKEQFNKVEAGLWEKILTRQITKNEGFKSLIKEEDGADYRPQNFPFGNIEAFRFLVLCSNRLPPDELLTQMYVLRIEFDDDD
eukprot:TRINITY_DN5660_c3_g1_i1.p1 TRINITY_DN5660_c3_g1~~TRINITY_DN5660_c3_g1_i1.p1  ORF type:complete len:553 (+),score=243.14 TRINITY_DN5660_c3_g1_i1:116-1774(+)